MMKQFHFLSGLPRSGSTLLSSILNQDERVYASANSPLLDMLYYNEQYWRDSEQGRANPKADSLKNVLRHLPHNFYEDVDRPIVVDKSRAWPNNIERIREVFGYEQPRIVCVVRSVSDILGSFLKLIHSQPEGSTNFIDETTKKMYGRVDDEARCEYLMSDAGIVELSLWAMRQGWETKDRSCLHVVEYDDLVSDPERTMKRAYDFLRLDAPVFDFDRVANPVEERDEVYGLAGMHRVRPRVERDKYEVDRDLVGRYVDHEFWRCKMKSVFRLSDYKQDNSQITDSVTQANQPKPPVPDILPNMHRHIMIQPGFLSEDVCRNLVEYGKTHVGETQGVFDPKKSTASKVDFEIDASTRNAQIVDTNEQVAAVLKEVLTNAVMNFVQPFYDTKIYSAENVQFLRYGVGGFYKPHCDGEGLWNNRGQLEWRRNTDRDFSVVVFLNADFEGGLLAFPEQGIVVPPRVGTLVAFPSTHHFMHAVTPVTKGERFSLVSWMDVVRSDKK